MWFKVDDKLHDHRKSRKAGKAAMGVWLLAGSWSMDNETDGFIPSDVLSRWGTAADARRLIEAGLWRETTQKGEQGFRFHDWSRFQPSAAVTAAKRAKEAEAGLRGNHKRWHVEREINDPDCEYCYRVPDGVPDDDPIGGGESGANRPEPVPDPVPEEETDVSSREDVERVCQHFSDRLKANGVKRHDVTKAWRTAARLMLDADGRTEDQVIYVIDWATADGFWQANILSVPKLREKFDQLALKARPMQRPVRSLPDVHDLERPPDGLSPEEYGEWEWNQRQKRPCR